MIQQFGPWEIDDALARIDFAVVHHWLAGTYWSPGISREKVERGAVASALVIGAYQGKTQAAFARVVSDRTRFAYLCDVFVEPAHRRRGLAQALVRFALDHPDLQVDKWILATRDAHDVYQKMGFQLLPDPEHWLIYRPPG